MNDIVRLARAYKFAARVHVNQRRKGEAAEPYVGHLAEVAALVTEATDGGDSELIIAAVLHDVVEDTPTPITAVERGFGERVAGLVAEVTDDKALPKAERKRLQVERAAHASVGAKLIKLADKTSNLRALAASPPVDWPMKRRLEYLAWAKQVVSGCRGVSPSLETAFDVAANAAWIAMDEGTCSCLKAGSGVGLGALGVDETEGRFADVSAGACRACGRRWLRYQVEYEYRSRSGRWAMCLLDPDVVERITPETAPEFLAAAPWHIKGGSFWGHAGQRSSGWLSWG